MSVCVCVCACVCVCVCAREYIGARVLPSQVCCSFGWLVIEPCLFYGGPEVFVS